MRGLFGDEVTEGVKKIKGIYARRKSELGYRKAIYDDERCKFCENSRRKKGNNKNYYKCILIGISDGEATDIELSNVCNFFKLDTQFDYIKKLKG